MNYARDLSKTVMVLLLSAGICMALKALYTIQTTERPEPRPARQRRTYLVIQHLFQMLMRR